MKKVLKKLNYFKAEIVVYLFMLILGIITMIFPEIGFNEPTLYSAILFFVIVFCGVIGYFMTRDERDNYELLYFSLISMFSAAYLFIVNYTGIPYILGTGFLTFTVLTTINKIYHINILKQANNYLWMLRSIALILILFLSVLTIQNFYRELSEVQTVMIGYFFVTYSVISILETILFIYVKPKDFEKFINGEFEEIGNPKKLRSLKKRNEEVEELDKIVKNIKVNKNKKKKKKITNNK